MVRRHVHRALRRKPIIVTDLDSTLYAFIPMFVEAARECFGIEVDPAPRTFLSPFEGMTKDQIAYSLAYCNTPEFMERHLPFEGAADILRDLQDRGYEIQYVTDRPSTTHDLTHEWLSKHGFPSPNSLVCCDGDKRAHVCSLRGRAVAIIDDKPNTMVWAYYEAKIPHVLAIRNSTNWNLDDVSFVHLADTWQELEEELLKRLP